MTKSPIPANTSPIIITDVNSDGQGVGRISTGEVVFVPGALAGEEVTCESFYRRKKIIFGRLAKIIKPSIERINPQCPHFDICGGCSLQHLSINAQLAHKQNHLLETITRIGNTKPQTVMSPIAFSDDRQWHYRRRARLSIKYVAAKDKVLVGFHEKDPRKVANLDSCLILAKPFGSLIPEISELLYKFPNREKIAQVEISLAEKPDLTPLPIFIFRNLVKLSSQEIHALKIFSQKHNSIVFLQPNSQDLLAIDPENSFSQINYHLTDWNLALNFLPTDFIQINALINQRLIAQAITWLELSPNDKIGDLFCGLGNFSLPIAKVGINQNITVCGIEGEQKLILMALKNAKSNQISNCDFFVDNLFTPNPTTIRNLNNFNKILLDPPRLGALEICSILPENINRIVYVSCHPATLARDCQILINKKFELQNIALVDMFPHTNHAEAIALFIKK